MNHITQAQVNHTTTLEQLKFPQVTNFIPDIRVKHFVKRFASVLNNLLDVLDTPEIKSDSFWANAIPFSTPRYGRQDTPSPGHMIRLDGILCSDGSVKFAEMDFVPAGAGTVAASLSEGERDDFLHSFADWYSRLDANRIFLATGSRTSIEGENRYFCELMRQRGINIESINIDTFRNFDPSDLIVRLFYRSECDREPPTNVRYLTTEPWLDSKAIFGLIHDPSQRKLLQKYLTQSGLDFLRKSTPETFLYDQLLRDLPKWFLELLAAGDVSNWVMKSGDVETDYCWGARSVIIGKMYSTMSSSRLRRAFLFGESLTTKKTLGNTRILQRYHESFDFKATWDTLSALPCYSRGCDNDGNNKDATILSEKAKSHVSARIGMYFLVDRLGRSVITPDFGYLTLRQSPLAHGASDAIQCAFRIV